MPITSRPRPPTEPRGGPRTASTTRWLAVAGLVLAAINLRPAVTSVGPVLEEIRADLGMSAAVAGLLTSMPAVCFALVGSTAPLLARRWGTGAVIALGTTALTLGLTVRPFAGGAASFIALTALALAGIALANVLLPVVVKERFPERVGAMTGIYSVALNLGAATAAAVTVPLTAGAFGGDWRLSLVVWAMIAAAALPAWILLAGDRTPAPDIPRDAGGTVTLPLRRQPIAWALAVYFGLQATAAYVIMGWLPQIFRDAGLSARTAGMLFAVTALLGVPLSFALSALAGRLRRQSGVAVWTGLFGLAGYAGLWADPAAAPWLWVALLGVANCSFPLALTMIALRGRNAVTVARLSAFAQGTGYLLSVPGPIMVGVLYEHTGSWRIPLTMMALLMVPQLAAGIIAGRSQQLG